MTHITRCGNIKQMHALAKLTNSEVGHSWDSYLHRIPRGPQF
ncbi:hypothetical protein SLEP1_g16136 [Rubroshorea leprosula]|uniref:Uncharacterized protein n=1 Tax=Rubroshorea leprosula TaxID=152421 RepID=A0AAV5IZ60_9ROSI|nr:hypothetical protein SLEP1_g16136 [Rubroshorea leprosula]